MLIRSHGTTSRDRGAYWHHCLVIVVASANTATSQSQSLQPTYTHLYPFLHPTMSEANPGTSGTQEQGPNPQGSKNSRDPRLNRDPPADQQVRPAWIKWPQSVQAPVPTPTDPDKENEVRPRSQRIIATVSKNRRQGKLTSFLTSSSVNNTAPVTVSEHDTHTVGLPGGLTTRQAICTPKNKQSPTCTENPIRPATTGDGTEQIRPNIGPACSTPIRKRKQTVESIHNDTLDSTLEILKALTDDGDITTPVP